jgi:hypothetical protein
MVLAEVPAADEGETTSAFSPKTSIDMPAPVANALRAATVARTVRSILSDLSFMCRPAFFSTRWENASHGGSEI